MDTPAVQLQFPAGGMVRRMAYQNQAPYSTAYSTNIWPDDSTLERERGGVRPGTEKRWTTDIGSDPNLIAEVDYASGGSLLTKTLVAAGGVLYYSNGTALTAVSPSPSLTLASDTTLGAAQLLQKLYIAGDNTGSRVPCVYNPADNTLINLTSTAGTMPTKCRLLTVFNNRLILAGDSDNPQNIYISRQGAPRDFDYAEDDVQAAFALNLSDQGKLGNEVRALIPHSRSCFLIGCRDEMWAMNGDAGVNGTLEKLGDNIGCVDANAWCYDSEGYLYFLSQDGLYMMPPGCGTTPRSVSRERLPQELLNIDRTTKRVSMAYDHRLRGVLLTVTTLASNAMDGWWIDTKQAQSGDSGGAVSFWPTTFADNGHHPFCLVSSHNGVPSSDGPGSVLMACRDGYVRRFNRTVSTDDSTNIVAALDYGPIPLGSPGTEGILQDVQVTLGASSGKALCSVRKGKGAEEAYGATALADKTFNRAGLNPTFHPRLRGQSTVIRFSNVSGSRFSLEEVTIRRIPAGRKRVS